MHQSADSQGGHADVGGSEAQSENPSTLCTHHYTRYSQEEQFFLLQYKEFSRDKKAVLQIF